MAEKIEKVWKYIVVFGYALKIIKRLPEEK